MRRPVRPRATALVVAAALLAVLVTAWLARGRQSHTAPLDPGNPDGNGAQALARVLVRQGVEVDVVRSADALDRAPTGASTLIVVTSADHLGRSTTNRLLRHQGAAGLVVVAPGPELVRQLGLTTYPVTDAPREKAAGGCPAYHGLSLDVRSAEAYQAPGCFRDHHGVLLARPRPGLTLLGAPAALTNDQVLAGDNAAIALRLLGQRPRLVWYVPDLADLAGHDGVSVISLLPGWLFPALWVLGMTGVAVIVWRGRRLGPLAREPLPVEVRAVETTRNLGRLYRRAGDRAHAADALRSAARARAVARLRLPRRVDPDVLVRTVAERTGRSPAEIEDLLGYAAASPAHDRDLTGLAQRLAALDRDLDREVSPR